MATRTLLVGLAVAGLACACSGGAGTPAPIPSGSREPPGSSPEPPGTPAEPGGSGQDPGGSGNEQPGGSGGTPATCPACDAAYSCQQALDGGTQTFTLTLVSANGVCTIQNSSGSVFSCSGTLTVVNNAGPVSVAWQPFGQGGFTAGGVTCVPQAPTGAPPHG